MHEDESSYLLLTIALSICAEEVKGPKGLDACVLDWPSDQYYMIREAEAWPRKVIVELRLGHEPAGLLLVWQNIEVIFQPRRHLASYYVSTAGVYGLFKLIHTFGVPRHPPFAYHNVLFVNDTEGQNEDVGCTGKVEFSLLSFGVFFQFVRVESAKRLPFRRLLKQRGGQGFLMCVPRAMIMEWSDYGILRFIDRMQFDPITEFIAVDHLFVVYINGFGSRGWFLFEDSTETFSHISGLAWSFCDLANGTGRNIVGSIVIYFTYPEEFAIRGMMFDFAKGALLQYVNKKIDYVWFPSFEAQHELLKRCAIPKALSLNECQATSSASVGADESEDGHEEWGLQNAVGSEKVERVGANCRLRDFRESFFYRKEHGYQNRCRRF